MCPKHIPGPTNIIYTYLTQQLMHDTHMTLKKWLGLCVGVIITKQVREGSDQWFPTLVSGPNLASADRVMRERLLT